MEPQYLCKKWHSSNSPLPARVRSYKDVQDRAEPDDCYSLQDIMQLSLNNQLSNIRVYDDYDDSPEGAEFEFGTDQFEYRQQLLDSQSSKRKKKKLDSPSLSETSPSVSTDDPSASPTD